MGKGFIILAAVGILFAYFVFNFVNDVEADDPTTTISKDERRAKEYARYYQKDALGERVLDFRGVPIAKAKEVWSESPFREEMLENFPQFELMKEYVKQRVIASPFQKYLLDKLDQVETDYFAGTIDSAEARRQLTEL